MTEKRFNIRVYGLLFNENNEVLLAEERLDGYQFTKFPGGGLEWGEGLTDCLKREFREELEIDIEVGDLFYFTDFFQPSAFRKEEQVISVYFKVHYSDYAAVAAIRNGDHAPALEFPKFFWKSVSDLTLECVTFPIDRLVVEKLMNEQENDLLVVPPAGSSVEE
jgi:ADP-ribose pyrophosphatase YjhB (NUDIX family)